MSHKHSIYDSDSHFSINPTTRVIKNESSSKTTLIQYDHNSERFTFEMPRYIEGHDMSLCNVVQVHYLNIDSTTKEQSEDAYDVVDLQLSPEDESIVICSWLISQNATKYVGSLNFVLRLSCVTDGVIEYAWNTAVYSQISVSTGIYNTDTIAEDYSDIIASWTARIEALEQGGGTGSGLTEEQAADLAANTEARHTHSNKDVLDCFGVNYAQTLPTFKGKNSSKEVTLIDLDSVVSRDNALRVDFDNKLTSYYTSKEIDEKGFITADDLETAIDNIPPVSDEQVSEAVNDYLAENPVGSEDFVLKEEFNNPHKYPNAQPTANLINLDNITYGYYVSETTGALTKNDTYRATEYIPVKPSTNYVGKSTTMRYAWYDKDKVFISGAKKVLNEVSPENAAYLRMTLSDSVMADFMIVEGTVYPQKFIPYRTKLPWLTPELPEMKAYDFAVDGAKTTENLFNKFSAEDGFFVGETNGVKQATSGHSITDFIKCKPSVLLSGNYGTRLCFYDENYRFISGYRFADPDNHTTTTPENTAYLRMSANNTVIENTMVVEGDSVPQIYVPYGVVAPWLHTETKLSKYHGKKMVCFGDSITYGGYNTVITEDTGIETVNAGFSSARYAYKENVGVKNYFSLYNIIDAICTGDWGIPEQIIGVEGYTGRANQIEKLKTVDFNTVDFVSFAYGTNDFGSATPYADSDNLYDINTVSGAVRYAIKTLLTTYPHIRIIVSLPIYRFFTDENNVVIEDSETKDFGGGTIPQYCEAIKKAAQDMKIPVVDMYNEGGINEFNRLNYFNITDGTHPNSKGSAVIGHGIAEGVLRYL